MLPMSMAVTARRAGLVAATASLVLMSMLGVSVSGAMSSPREGGVAIVFAPGVASDDTVRRVLAAGALPVRQGGAANVAIARIDEPATVARLYAAGAWLVVGMAIANGCGPEAGSPNRRSI
jgi:hypothetical protein